MFEHIGKILKKYHNKQIKRNQIKNNIINDILKYKNNDYKIHKSLSKRSHFDFEIFNDNERYIFDMKIYDYDTITNVSNLMSINKIKDEIDNNTEIYFIFICHDKNNIINDISFKSIYNLKWKNLLIQNLGKGQMQIKNLTYYMQFDDFKTKEDWISEFKDKVLNYYEKLILKISENKSNWENAFMDN